MTTKYKTLNLSITVEGDIEGESFPKNYDYKMNSDLLSNFSEILIPTHIKIAEINNFKAEDKKSTFYDKSLMKNFIIKNPGTNNPSVEKTIDNIKFLMTKIFLKKNTVFYIKCNPFEIIETPNINCDARIEFMSQSNINIDQIRSNIVEENKKILLDFIKSSLTSSNLGTLKNPKEFSNRIGAQVTISDLIEDNSKLSTEKKKVIETELKTINDAITDKKKQLLTNLEPDNIAKWAATKISNLNANPKTKIYGLTYNFDPQKGIKKGVASDNKSVFYCSTTLKLKSKISSVPAKTLAMFACRDKTKNLEEYWSKWCSDLPKIEPDTVAASKKSKTLKALICADKSPISSTSITPLLDKSTRYLPNICPTNLKGGKIKIRTKTRTKTMRNHYNLKKGTSRKRIIKYKKRRSIKKLRKKKKKKTRRCR